MRMVGQQLRAKPDGMMPRIACKKSKVPVELLGRLQAGLGRGGKVVLFCHGGNPVFASCLTGQRKAVAEVAAAAAAGEQQRETGNRARCKDRSASEADRFVQS